MITFEKQQIYEFTWIIVYVNNVKSTRHATLLAQYRPTLP